ncbi:hypothetical protein CFIO01_03674 [Colletotrichum fioriniae PJ7]|uniref:Cyanovirin-N domain-containing protein n=1 Tax=Colletotrichum fioriniae PJ7 TaxID=1445577 RepID=A0A010QHY9_9PEZI|nr:hypothetical protein CFIO01_03674 [Colletotrichum fioriniae PJ7]
MKIFNIIVGLAIVGFAAAAKPNCPEHSDCMQNDCINFDLNKFVGGAENRSKSTMLTANCPNRKKGANEADRVGTTLDLHNCIGNNPTGFIWKEQLSPSNVEILALF